MRKSLGVSTPIILFMLIALVALCPLLKGAVLKGCHPGFTSYTSQSSLLDSAQPAGSIAASQAATDGPPQSQGSFSASSSLAAPGAGLNMAGTSFGDAADWVRWVGPTQNIPASAPRALAMLEMCLVSLMPVAGQLWRAARY